MECPLVAGIPKAAFGIYPRSGDFEFNLGLGRMGILWKVDVNVGRVVEPEDPKVRDRLVYENTAFHIRRIMSQRREYESQRTELSGGWLSRRRKRTLDRNLEKLDERMDEEREGFRTSVDRNHPGSRLSMDSFDQILQTEGISFGIRPEASGGKVVCSSLVPVFRNPETLKLVYAEVVKDGETLRFLVK